jgi:hypothetical protein
VKIRPQQAECNEILGAGKRGGGAPRVQAACKTRGTGSLARSRPQAQCCAQCHGDFLLLRRHRSDTASRCVRVDSMACTGCFHAQHAILGSSAGYKCVFDQGPSLCQQRRRRRGWCHEMGWSVRYTILWCSVTNRLDNHRIEAPAPAQQ